jgi:tetratricopeptide (TPR) repeat protein
MTRRPAWGGSVWVLAGGLAALGLFGAFFRQERGSLERGNRFYRAGSVERAGDIYRSRAESDLTQGVAAYNLGTALLAGGAPEAEDYLRAATEGVDSAAVQRGYYNLGQVLLSRMDDAAGLDEAIPLLTAAVDNNRAALRLDPGDEDARWNLALAQLLLDSLSTLAEFDEPSSEEETDRAEPDEGMVIPQVAQLGPRRGREYEAVAGEDPGSINEAEARALLDAVGTDVEALIRGILWSLRPDVSPWEEPYPGGNR